MASLEKITADNSAQQKRIDRIATRIASISKLHDLADSPSHIAEQVKVRNGLSTSALPEDVEANIKKTILRLARNEEEELYAQEFPGHEPPEPL